MDKDPARARVIFDLPREHVPALMSTLGSFALDHDFAFSIDEAPMESAVDPQSAETLGYDPAFVTMLAAEEGEEPVAVVTKDTIDKFATERGWSTGSAERLVNQLGVAAIHDYTQLQGMLYGRNRKFGGFFATGLRVDSIRQVEHMLRNRDVSIRHLGVKSADLLSALRRELFFEDQ